MLAAGLGLPLVDTQLMTTTPKHVYLLKPAIDGDGPPAINRTISILGDGPFTISVTDLDYGYYPRGQKKTVLFKREGYASIQEADAEVEIQTNLSLEEGLIRNRYGMI